ncbi:LysR family transcriptional regulator, partial [Enterococcus hirae]
MSTDGVWPWPKDAWYQIAWNSELGDKPLARTIMGQKVVVFRGPDGKSSVLEDMCCHRAAPLSMG